MMEVGKGKRAQNADPGGSLGEALALRWCSRDLASCPGIFDLLPIMALKSLTFLTLIFSIFSFVSDEDMSGGKKLEIPNR